jgi:hypothetical protein
MQRDKPIGEIGNDWNPLGFSRRDAETASPTASTADSVCDVNEWDDAEKRYKDVFGSRSFFIHNFKIFQTRKRYLIQFEDPDRELIPDVWNDREH